MAKHGTISRYVHGPTLDGTEGKGCRCDECRGANSVWSASSRHKRGQRKGELLPEAHGKDSTYINWECRCADCRAAHRAAVKRYTRERTVTA